MIYVALFAGLIVGFALGYIAACEIGRVLRGFGYGPGRVRQIRTDAVAPVETENKQ